MGRFPLFVSAMVFVSGLALVPVPSLAQPSKSVVPDVLFSFDQDPITHRWLSGRTPWAPLVEDKTHPGIFFGTTIEEGDPQPNFCTAGNNCGTIFKVDTTATPPTTTVIYSFGAKPNDGVQARGGLVLANGYLWGTTRFGGAGVVGCGCGILFRIDPNDPNPAATYKIVHSFGDPADADDGIFPEYGLVKSSRNGKLYGTTLGGGGGGGGTGSIFEVDPSASTYRKVHSFGGGDLGSFPNALMEASDLKLYGSTQGGMGGGFVFAFDPSTMTYDAWSFNDFGGTLALGILAEDIGGGILYGTTSRGGANNLGTVFSFDTTRTPPTFVNLYSFDSTSTNGHGADPRGGLVMGSDGTLYGTTFGGGASHCFGGCGTIFSIKPGPPSSANFLYDFFPVVTVGDGFQPQAGLIEGSDGKLYGTTTSGGSSSNAFGTVYRSDKASLIAWVNQLGSAGKRDSANGIATWTDPSGNTFIYVVGDTESDLGGANQGGSDAFVVKYHSDGTLDTTFGPLGMGKLQFGTPADDSATGVTVDGFGNVYVSGWTKGDLAFPGANQGGSDAWVAKFDSTGVNKWLVQFGTPADDAANAVAVDITNNVYVTGSTQGTLPGGSLTGIADAFLAALDPFGVPLGFTQWGTPGEFGSASGVAACDSSIGRSIYVSGSHAPDPLGDRSTAFLRSFDGTSFGSLLWEQTESSSDGTFSWTGVATDSACSAYVAGASAHVPVPEEFIEFYLVAKYDPLGTLLWETAGPERVLVTRTDFANAVTVDASGRVYVSGNTRNNLAGAFQGGQVLGDAWLGTHDGVTGAKLPSGSRQVGTGDGPLSANYDDVSNAVAVDSAGNAYIAGLTEGPMGGPGSEADVGFGDVFVAGLGTVLPPAPTITGFTPPRGSAGNTIMINGTNFAGTSTVAFTSAAGFVNVRPSLR